MIQNDKEVKLLKLIKQQANELVNWREMTMKLEESNKRLIEDVKTIGAINKHLESLILSLKLERQKLFEDAQELLKTKQLEVR